MEERDQPTVEATRTSPVWWRRPGGMEPYRCSLCGEVHCYWCGERFPETKVNTHNRLAPTVDHLYPVGQRKQPKGTLTRVVAHAVCNQTRQHDYWSWSHSGGTRPEKQRQARESVLVGLQNVALWKAVNEEVAPRE